MKPWNQRGKLPWHRSSVACVSTNHLTMCSLCPLSRRSLPTPCVLSICFSVSPSEIFIFWYKAASICSIMSISLCVPEIQNRTTQHTSDKVSLNFQTSITWCRHCYRKSVTLHLPIFLICKCVRGRLLIVLLFEFICYLVNNNLYWVNLILLLSLGSLTWASV